MLGYCDLKCYLIEVGGCCLYTSTLNWAIYRKYTIVKSQSDQFSLNDNQT